MASADQYHMTIIIAGSSVLKCSQVYNSLRLCVCVVFSLNLNADQVMDFHLITGSSIFTKYENKPKFRSWLNLYVSHVYPICGFITQLVKHQTSRGHDWSFKIW